MIAEDAIHAEAEEALVLGGGIAVQAGKGGIGGIAAAQKGGEKVVPAGLAKLKAAWADGSWNALDAIEALEVPADLAEALAGYPDATAHFEAFPRSVKRGILKWITAAKQPETRARRIEETSPLAAENVRANQWRP